MQCNTKLSSYRDQWISATLQKGFDRRSIVDKRLALLFDYAMIFNSAQQWCKA